MRWHAWAHRSAALRMSSISALMRSLRAAPDGPPHRVAVEPSPLTLHAPAMHDRRSGRSHRGRLVPGPRGGCRCMQGTRHRHFARPCCGLRWSARPIQRVRNAVQANATQFGALPRTAALTCIDVPGASDAQILTVLLARDAVPQVASVIRTVKAYGTASIDEAPSSAERRNHAAGALPSPRAGASPHTTRPALAPHGHPERHRIGR